MDSETREYACRWTDWDDAGDEHKTRTRYQSGGYGDEGRRSAEHVAWQTRNWQPGQGLAPDAVVVSRPIGAWTVED
jgi:hypothetical protein